MVPRDLTARRAGAPPPPFSMTRTRPRVRKPRPLHGDELPVVPVRAQRQPQDAPARVVPDFAIGQGGAQIVMRRTAGADDELANAARGIGRAAGRLGGEALVGVV